MKYDLVIVGSGLAGSLLLAGIKYHHPRLKILLLEKGKIIGGNHTWCFHEQDLPEKCQAWLLPLVSKIWGAYEVKFPEYSRVLNSRYFCIKSTDLHEKLSQLFPKNLRLESEVLSWQKTTSLEKGTILILKDGTEISTTTLIDARGWIHAFSNNTVGWKKFVGLEVSLKNPHGLKRVILKDATVTQIDGYRFFRLLPFSDSDLLVQDTYYSNHPILKDERIEQEIKKYIEDKGWQIDSIKRKEIGCLPLSLHASHDRPPENSIGGYTLPMTLQVIDQVLENSSLTENGIAQQARKIKERFAGHEKYFRLFNRMMFLATEPTKRYLLLQYFYRLDEAVIQRFYAGKLGALDRLRILFGKPPVPLFKALKALKDDEAVSF
jgi:lycopene beta-cyclase